MPLEEAGGGVVSVREQMEDAEGDGVRLEPVEQARANAVTLLLLPDDTEGDLEESSHAVGFEYDGAEHAPGRCGRAQQHERLMVGCEDELGGVRASDEGEG